MLVLFLGVVRAIAGKALKLTGVLIWWLANRFEETERKVFTHPICHCHSYTLDDGYIWTVHNRSCWKHLNILQYSLSQIKLINNKNIVGVVGLPIEAFILPICIEINANPNCYRSNIHALMCYSFCFVFYRGGNCTSTYNRRKASSTSRSLAYRLKNPTKTTLSRLDTLWRLSL